ncbi:helix-turn-helix transcriptional regulator [Mucilaginibacter sp.]|uniref:AraC family transcriptional regulator n=1 Tax=Mucilaginibacter sp. TaxID=1882438 RepID=UPI0025EA282B|nr:helix-turn-helix transcriptional regulator [Mucilaginibacter sp.]
MKSEFKVYDICEFSLDRQQDVIVSRFDVYLKNLKYLHFPHRHDFYHLILFTHGGGSFSIDFQNFKIIPYRAYFMAPGQVHGWDFEGNMDGYVINFSVQFFQSFLLKSDYLDQFYFLNGIAGDSVIDILEEQRASITEILENAVREMEKQHRFKTDAIRVWILQLFLQIGNMNVRNEVHPADSYNMTLLRNFEKLIEKNYLNLRLPKQYAELLFITPNHLNALCNEVLGKSAGDLIRNRIALEAKRMLINFNLTVTEIAYALNFEDNSYFCKFFKKQAGLSPDGFRKHIHTDTE